MGLMALSRLITRYLFIKPKPKAMHLVNNMRTHSIFTIIVLICHRPNRSIDGNDFSLTTIRLENQGAI